jgi:hypothetical protein
LEGDQAQTEKKAEFTLADGTTIDRKISECHIALNGEDGHTPVILGEPGDHALLGVITLENLGLVFDPFKRELRPMKLRLGKVGRELVSNMDFGPP